ncbi:MAG: FKBP-type peptidyl-prolyl cis-trans isomerase [Bacteroidales bacterium]
MTLSPEIHHKIHFIIPILFLLLIAFTGCGEIGTWKVQEEQMIQDYLDKLGDTVVVLKPSGLYYIDLQEGTGLSPVTGDSVSFFYKGMFLDRVVFDTNLDDSIAWKCKVGANQLLAGIDEGLTYMKEGGKARLLTPSKLAYGHGGWWGIIPGYTPLIWEIDLISVKKAK